MVQLYIFNIKIYFCHLLNFFFSSFFKVNFINVLLFYVLLFKLVFSLSKDVTFAIFSFLYLVSPMFLPYSVRVPNFFNNNFTGMMCLTRCLSYVSFKVTVRSVFILFVIISNIPWCFLSVTLGLVFSCFVLRSMMD